MMIFGIIAGFILLCAIVVKAFFIYEGDPDLRVKVAERTPFEIVDIDDKKIVIKSKVEFTNVGKQCATVMDCFVRTLLPYEQYDGIEAWGKAEREDEPREDDYFEAVLVEKKKSIFVNIIVRLSARKDMSLKEAMSHMVDLPMDIVYTELGREPWKLKKVRVVLTAEEIARLTGVELVDD